MSQYTYTIRTHSGGEKDGVIEAASTTAAAHLLREQGVILKLTFTTTKKRKKTSFTLFSIPLKERVIFAVNLSVMVESGLPIARSLVNIAEQMRNKQVKKIINEMRKKVVAGTSLSDAMEAQPTMFDHLFVSMVRVGEIGGSLSESLLIVARQLEKEQQLRSRVRGAMMYPMIVLLAMTGVSVLMLTYILPQIMSVFDGMDVALPASTQFIVNMSDALRDNAMLVGVGTVVGIISFILFLRTALGHRFSSAMAINLPIVRTMSVSVNCARFARIHSSLLRSGVPVVQSLTIVRDTLGNVYYRDVIDEAAEAVQRGIVLADIIRKHPRLFPVMVPQMLDVGEETGKTSVMLLKVADFYEARVEQITKNLSSIVEPLLMVVIGLGVGFFAVAMLKPMYSLMENI